MSFLNIFFTYGFLLLLWKIQEMKNIKKKNDVSTLYSFISENRFERKQTVEKKKQKKSTLFYYVINYSKTSKNYNLSIEQILTYQLLARSRTTEIR